MSSGGFHIEEHFPLGLGASGADEPLIKRKIQRNGGAAKCIWKILLAITFSAVLLCVIVYLQQLSLYSRNLVLLEESVGSVNVRYANLLNVDVPKALDDLVAEFEVTVSPNTSVILPVRVDAEALDIIVMVDGNSTHYVLAKASVKTAIPLTPKNSMIVIPFKLWNIDKLILKMLLGELITPGTEGSTPGLKLLVNGDVKLTIMGLFKSTQQLRNVEITNNIFPPSRSSSDGCSEYRLVLNAKDSSGTAEEGYDLEYELRIPNPSVVRIADPNITVRAYAFIPFNQEVSLFGMDYKTSGNALALPCNILKTGAPESDNSLRVFNVAADKLTDIINSSEDEFDFVFKNVSITHKKNAAVGNWILEATKSLLIHAKTKVKKEHIQHRRAPTSFNRRSRGSYHTSATL